VGGRSDADRERALKFLFGYLKPYQICLCEHPSDMNNSMFVIFKFK